MSGRDDNATFLGDDDSTTWADGPADPVVTQPATTLDITPDDATIGQYRILDVLGEGGMGVVYKAEQQSPRRLVAVKVIRRGVATESMRRRFAFEAEVLARLDHPGIARILEAVAEGPRSWFAMEYVDGDPLDVYVRRAEPSVDVRVTLLAAIADAVHHAHMKGVIHRDLKPGNILVDAEGNPKILDFGIARSVDTSQFDLGEQHTRIGQIIGTPAYMSPEQAAGSSQLLDGRSDVYALGIIAWELFAGRVPHDFAGLPLDELVRTIRTVDVPALRGAVDVPRDLDSIVAKAVRKAPEERYQSAAAFADDLRRYLADEPILARPATATDQILKFARRNKALSAAVLGIFAVSSVGFVTSTALYLNMEQAFRDEADARRIADVARAAESEARTTLQERNDALIVLQARSLLATDPTHAVAFVRTLDHGPWDDVASIFGLARGLGLASDVLVGHTDEVRRGAINPDGVHYASAAYDDTVRIWNVRQRSVIVLPMTSDARFAVWSPRGDMLAFGARDGTLGVWDGEQRRDWPKHADALDDMVWSPDGQRLLTASKDGTARIWDRRGAYVALEGHTGEVGTVAWLDDSRVATAGEDGDVRLWTVQGVPGRVLRGHQGEVMWLDATPTRLVSAGKDGTARLWDVGTGRARVIGPHDDELRVVHFAEGGIVLADRGGRIATYALDGTPIASVRGHTGVIRELSVSPDGRTAGTGGDDGDAFLWSLPDLVPRALPGHRGRVRSLSFHGGDVLSGSADGTLRVWPVRDLPPRVLHGHDGAIRDLLFHDGDLVSAGEDGSVRRWSLEGGVEVDEVHTDEVDALLVHEGDLVSTGRDGRIRIHGGATLQWEGTVDSLASQDGVIIGAARKGGMPMWTPATGSLQVLPHDDRITAVAFLDGAPVTGTANGTVRHWTGAVPVVLATLGDAVSSLQVRGGRLAIAGEDGTIIVDGKGRQLGVAAYAATFSPDGRLAVGGADGRLELDGTSLVGHSGAILAVAFLPDGRLVSAGEDRAVRVWDGPASQRLTGPERPVRALAISPEGRWIAGGDEEGTIFLWSAEPASSVLRRHIAERTRAELDDQDRLTATWN